MNFHFNCTFLANSG
uniref:Uncharacterized protein n=1 Tax=Anguilla anguilla TaxID=7936 RepID=A0A0E9PVQ0_ANGAN